jgi:glutathione-specific gamma-glutamylcyclotransferase
VSGPAQDLWVFGYGSLMWRPGFAYVERQAALLHGFHRSLCVYSFVHRGTREAPGLVMGLDRGGACRGVAFRVVAHAVPETVAYLRAREQINGVYLDQHRPVRLQDGRLVTALAYVVDRRHPQYSGKLPRAEIVRHVRQGVGQSGANPEYVVKTHEMLAEMGVRDRMLSWVVQAVRD